MKFGVILPNYGPGAGRLAVLDTAQAAESLGYDSVWLTDHVALPEADAERFTPIFEAVTTLAYLAGATGQIRLGISALVLPQRSAVLAAKQLATADVLSGGRVILAAGVGWSAGEYAALGSEFASRGARMDEALRVLRTLWRGGKIISFEGKYTSFDKVVFRPATVQSGGPPLWVAGNSPRALRRAVLLADGWHPDSLPPEEITRRLRVVQPLLAGRPFAVAPRLGVAFDAAPQEGVPLSGTPAQIIEQVRAYAAAGADTLVLSFKGIETDGERLQALRRFAREVIPPLGR